MKGFINKAKDFIGLGIDEEETVMEMEEQKKDFVGLDLGPFKPRVSKKNNGSDLNVAIYEPKAYENSIEISARLRKGSPVIVNLKYMDSSEGTRLIDFVCGTAFAIDGHMMKIADTIFLLTPSEVSIADLSERNAGDSAVVREGLLHNRL